MSYLQKMFSQNKEEQFILEYFRGERGKFLDIGAYDGVNLSNTRALAVRGWGGIYIEPSPAVYEKLVQHSQYLLGDIHSYNYAIGTQTGKQKFYDNHNYVATLVRHETERWKDETFTETEVEVLTFEDFYKRSPIKEFDFISIDAEGMDYDILCQIDLKKVKCQMICVEHNGIETDKYYHLIAGQGYREIHRNAENLIMAI